MKIKVDLEWNDYQISEPLEKQYTWDKLMEIDFPDGWVVPTKSRLVEIYDSNYDYFKNDEDYYWSSSSVANYSGYAWIVGFDYGSTNRFYRRFDGSVRLVRLTQKIKRDLINETN